MGIIINQYTDPYIINQNQNNPMTIPDLLHAQLMKHLSHFLTAQPQREASSSGLLLKQGGPKRTVLGTSLCLATYGRYVGLFPLPRMPVTTRIVMFLVGDPELNLHLPLLLGGGTIQNIRNSYVLVPAE